jgi:hypothetical protein
MKEMTKWGLRMKESLVCCWTDELRLIKVENLWKIVRTRGVGEGTLATLLVRGGCVWVITIRIRPQFYRSRSARLERAVVGPSRGPTAKSGKQSLIYSILRGYAYGPYRLSVRRPPNLRDPYGRPDQARLNLRPPANHVADHMPHSPQQDVKLFTAPVFAGDDLISHGAYGAGGV